MVKNYWSLWRRCGMARAFSLVEMLVVMTILLMVLGILAMAYDGASRAMRMARGVNQSDSDLSNFDRELRWLLRQRHFEGDLKVSQIVPTDPNRQPVEGFFSVIEGNSPAGEIDLDDGLNFTVRLVGNGPGGFFETNLLRPTGWSLPPGFTDLAPPFPTILTTAGYPESRYQQGNIYRSQWAEIAIFLSRQPDPEDPTKRAATVPPDHPAHPDPPSNGPAAKLYRLHLRKLLLAPSHFAKGPANFDLTGRIVVHNLQPIQSSSPFYYPDAFDLSLRRETSPISASEQWVLNTPSDVRNGANRFYNPSIYFAPRPWEPNEQPNDWPRGWPGPLGTRSGRPGTDIVLHNVVSFDVKLILSGSVSDGNYDSTSNQPLQGLWIRVRIFNPKTQQLRDIVIVEAL